ncbi:DNA-3-methyladenine glycosylase family protein [Sanguibacter suaedae]|uniref:DNA-3-methyladenine glycosylase 2 family protein n=1 Tax=Sanguibacter suaedae TaxID=2795737 RepID=A0A934I121_9MICO|nr:DNA-3-methyladenine glycosylase 2 family protein [Sanguibacter suaedae]MBI9113614.1 DNA-3-methyladenine glycosylase 2 family protein [Sanguibacter suaedae]
MTRETRMGAPQTGGRADVDLPVRQPFDAPGVFAFLAARAVQGVEVADLSDDRRLRYARTLLLPHGPATVEVVASRAPRTGWRLTAHLELASAADVDPAVARLRHLLDLDADPVAVDHALSADPSLAPLVARTPGIRVPGTVDPHELVLRALVGQQISVSAARTHLSRLATACGTPTTSDVLGLTRLFPTPAQVVAGVPGPVPGDPPDADRILRLPGQATRGILGVCRALADGDLVVDEGVDADRLRSDLLARPRIGPWTASYVAMRVLGDPDAWLDGDVALVAGARAVGILDADVPRAAASRVLAAHAARWAPWRSYAAMHLWLAAIV